MSALPNIGMQKSQSVGLSESSCNSGHSGKSTNNYRKISATHRPGSPVRSGTLPVDTPQKPRIFVKGSGEDPKTKKICETRLYGIRLAIAALYWCYCAFVRRGSVKVLWELISRASSGPDRGSLLGHRSALRYLPSYPLPISSVQPL